MAFSLAKYLRNGCDSEIHREVATELDRQASVRMVWLSLFFGALFGTYSLTITEYLQKSYHDLSMWGNTWPRLLMNSIPSFLLAAYLRKSRASARFKCLVFYVAISAIYLLAANIYTWKSAFDALDLNIMALMLGPNAIVFVLLTSVAAPSILVLCFGSIAHIAIFWVPYLYSSRLYSDPSLVSMIEGGTLMIFVIGHFTASALALQRAHGIGEAILTKRQTLKSVSKTTADSLYDKSFDFKKIRERRGLFLVFDLRSSSGIKNMPRGGELIRELMRLSIRSSEKYESEIINDRGDGLFLFFGPKENQDLVDLDGVPDIATDLAWAERRIYQGHFNEALSFIKDMTDCLSTLEQRFTIRPINLGFAVTMATCTFSFLEGEKNTREHWDTEVLSLLDRLEKQAKRVKVELDIDGSVVVFSDTLRMFTEHDSSIHTRTFDDADFPSVSEYDFSVMMKIQSISQRRAA